MIVEAELKQKLITLPRKREEKKIYKYIYREIEK